MWSSLTQLSFPSLGRMQNGYRYKIKLLWFMTNMITKAFIEDWGTCHMEMWQFCFVTASWPLWIPSSELKRVDNLPFRVRKTQVLIPFFKKIPLEASPNLSLCTWVCSLWIDAKNDPLLTRVFLNIKKKYNALHRSIQKLKKILLLKILCCGSCSCFITKEAFLRLTPLFNRNLGMFYTMISPWVAITVSHHQIYKSATGLLKPPNVQEVAQCLIHNQKRPERQQAQVSHGKAADETGTCIHWTVIQSSRLACAWGQQLVQCVLSSQPTPVKTGIRVPWTQAEAARNKML
jgi:hypothetical protein